MNVSQSTKKRNTDWQRLAAIKALLVADRRQGVAELARFIAAQNVHQQGAANSEWQKYRLVVPHGQIFPRAIINAKGTRYGITFNEGEPWQFGKTSEDTEDVPNSWMHREANELARVYGLPIRLISKHQRIAELRISNATGGN